MEFAVFGLILFFGGFYVGSTAKPVTIEQWRQAEKECDQVAKVYPLTGRVECEKK